MKEKWVQLERSIKELLANPPPGITNLSYQRGDADFDVFTLSFLDIQGTSCTIVFTSDFPDNTLVTRGEEFFSTPDPLEKILQRIIGGSTTPQAAPVQSVLLSHEAGFNSTLKRDIERYRILRGLESMYTTAGRLVQLQFRIDISFLPDNMATVWGLDRTQPLLLYLDGLDTFNYVDVVDFGRDLTCRVTQPSLLPPDADTSTGRILLHLADLALKFLKQSCRSALDIDSSRTPTGDAQEDQRLADLAKELQNSTYGFHDEFLSAEQDELTQAGINYRDVKQADLQRFGDCSICLDTLSTSSTADERAVVLVGCEGHGFHLECLRNLLRSTPPPHNSLRCPVCSSSYGAPQTGTQPSNGTMTSSTSSTTQLPGFPAGSGVITIQYAFPNGVTHEGVGYHGASRTAYLPNTEKGRLVLSLLQTAFSRRLVFRVGESSTLGTSAGVRVCWAIHHKTSISGSYGYPDETYLDRVLSELADVGVVHKAGEDLVLGEAISEQMYEHRQSLKASPSCADGLLIQLERYVRRRLLTLNQFCVVCDNPHLFFSPEMLELMCCATSLCAWSFEKLGVGSKAATHVFSGGSVVDLLTALTAIAARSDRADVVLAPFPASILTGPRDHAVKRMREILGEYPSATRTLSQAFLAMKDNSFVPTDLAIARKLHGWILATNRALIVPLAGARRLNGIKTPHQYCMVTVAPEREERFQALKRTHGSVFAFHGSPTENWHSIVRKGLINASGTKLQLHGAAYGNGIYLSPQGTTSLAYCLRNSQHHSSHSAQSSNPWLNYRKLFLMAVCEVINDSQMLSKKNNSIWVCTNEEHVVTRFLFVFTNEIDQNQLPVDITSLDKELRDVLNYV